MNWVHRRLCRSAWWRKQLEGKVMPWVLDGVNLGLNVLEVGPGPGLTTDLLRPRLARLIALEIDPALAGSLAARLRGSNSVSRATAATRAVTSTVLGSSGEFPSPPPASC